MWCEVQKSDYLAVTELTRFLEKYNLKFPIEGRILSWTKKGSAMVEIGQDGSLFNTETTCSKVFDIWHYDLVIVRNVYTYDWTNDRQVTLDKIEKK